VDALVLPVTHADREPSTDERARFRRVFLRVAPSMFIGTLDQAIVAAALPKIAADLGGLADISWLITAYLLAATIAAPIYGRLGDAFGRKRALLVALGLFLLGSIACGVAPTLLTLIAARALQGLGGGGLMTLSQALIGEAVSPKERGRFQGWFGAIFALASMLGPVAGGMLSDAFGWRSIFFVNVPLGVGAGVVAFGINASRGGGRFTPDLLGTPVFVGATISLLLSLSMATSKSWLSPAVITLSIAGILGFALLRRLELNARDPLIPPDLVTQPVVWRCAFCVLLFAALLFAVVVELPLLLEVGCAVSPTTSGLLLLPLMLAQVGVSTLTGTRVSKTGHPRGPMVAGLAVASVGLFALSQAASLGPSVIAAASIVVGIGLGTTMPAAQTIVQWAAGTARLGIATATLSFARSIGGVIGAAVASAILIHALRVLAPSSPEVLSKALSEGHTNVAAGALAQEIHIAFQWVFAILGVLGAIAAVVAKSLPDVDLAAAPPVTANAIAAEVA
jgi:EmrB/QacA subfamily drug resistance transporter